MLDYRAETFLTVCQEMNYTKAADILNITQPNVSQHIKWLEEMYHQKLFIYKGRKLMLTEAGEILKNAITAVRHEDELFRQRLNALNEKRKSISFGVTKSIYEGSMKKNIVSLLEKYAADRLKFSVNNTGGLVEELKSGTLDFAIVEGNFEKELFDSLVLKEDNFIPVCAPDYPFTGTVRELKDLFSETLIIRESGSGSREILAHVLGSRNFDFHSFSAVMEIGEIGAMKALLKAGRGISFLYKTAVEEELEEGTLVEIPLDEIHVRHAFCMIWLKTEQFLDYYRELAAEIMGE